MLLAQLEAFVEAARTSERLLLNAAGDNTLRFVPPLVISSAQIADMLVRFERTIERVRGAAR